MNECTEQYACFRIPGSAFNLLYGLTEKVYNQGEIYGSVKDKNN